MGHFNEYCPITRLPIMQGEEVVIFASNKQYLTRENRDLYQWIEDEIRHYNDILDFTEEETGTRPAGRFENVEQHYFDKNCKIVFGHYNQYGWIEEDEDGEGRPDDWMKGEQSLRDRSQITYVHKSVVDMVVGCDSSQMNKLELLGEITLWCIRAHVTFWSDEFVRQDIGDEKLDIIQQLHKITNKRFKQLIKYANHEGWRLDLTK